MPALAGKILDIFDDPGVSLVKEAAQSGISVPDFILSYRLPADPQAIPDELFAHVAQPSHGEPIRKYACDTKASTWLSGLYFLKHGGVFPEKLQQKIATKLAHFHSLHGIPCPELITKIAAAEDAVPVAYQLPSEPVTEEMFALTSTSKEPRYPIVDWNHIEKAAKYFDDNWRVMPIPQRREFATKVANRVRTLAQETLRGKHEINSSLIKVAALDMKKGDDPVQRLPKMLELYSSNIPCDSKIAMAIDERVKTMEKRNQSELASTYKLLFDNRGSYTLDKFAQALGRIDEASGLSDLYGKRLLDPYLSILKVAGDLDDEVIPDQHGINLTRRDLKKLASMKNELCRQFDPEIVKELAADPETVFPSLPLTEKQALAAFIRR